MTDRLTPSDAIASLTAYRVPRHPAPVDLPLDGNEGPAPDPAILARLASQDVEAVLRRYPDRSPLEARLAAHWDVDADRVLATSGADDGLDRACRALLGPGREIILPTPTFAMLPRYAAWSRGEVVEVPWGDGAFPVEDVLTAVTDRTTLIAAVSPNNPTGAVISADQLTELAHAAAPALILLDHAYVEFADTDLTRHALSLPNVLVFRTLSKAWGMAGARVGYVLGPAEVVGWLRAAGNPYTLTGPSIALAMARLDEGPEGVSSFAARVRAERAPLAEQLAAHGFALSGSQANFVFGRSDRAPWLRDALAGLGLGIRGWPGHPQLGDAVRITLPGDADDFARLTAAVDAALAPEALLLDMDGVIADVSRSYRAAILQTAEHFGASLTAEDVRAAKAAGDANNDWILTQRLLADRGVEVSLDEVTEAFEARYQGTDDAPGLRATETLLPARSTLERLAARRPLGIVTGRPRRDARAFLDQHGLTDLFEVVVCMEDGPAKPDPAPVRKALDALGVSSAWLVGDTVDDLVAARSAGVVPLGIVPPGEPADLTTPTLLSAGAARVLGDLSDLLELP